MAKDVKIFRSKMGMNILWLLLFAVAVILIFIAFCIQKVVPRGVVIALAIGGSTLLIISLGILLVLQSVGLVSDGLEIRPQFIRWGANPIREVHGYRIVYLTLGKKIVFKKKDNTILDTFSANGFSYSQIREILLELQKQGKQIKINPALEGVFDFEPQQKKKSGRHLEV